MKIGIIGAGNVGVGLGRRLAASGHAITISFARSVENVVAAAAAIGPDTRAAAPLEAAESADVVILATPWAVSLDAVRGIAAAIDRKILWDATNPLKPDLSGLEIGLTNSGGEEIARAAPKARVVKAIPPFAEWLQSDSTRIGGARPGVFVCGDDAEARAIVLGLVADVDADGVDAGPLANARYTEPLGMLLVQLAYKRGLGARIGSALLRDH